MGVLHAATVHPKDKDRQTNKVKVEVNKIYNVILNYNLSSDVL